MLDFKENVNVLLTKLHIDLAKSKDCEGSNVFIKSVKDLARNYYDYFNCESRRFHTRILVDIQAEFELSEKNLQDFENLSKNLFNIIFTLRALGTEIDKMKNSLELLYNQIHEFWVAVKSIQSQNIKLIKILTEVWKVLTNLKKHLYTLNRHQKEFIENNLELGIVSFAEYITSTPNEELNSLLKSLGNASMYFSETIRQMRYLNSLLFNHQKLKSIHILFSFQLVLLINNPESETNSNATQSKIKELTKKSMKTCCCLTEEKKPNFINVPEESLREIEKETLKIGSEIHKTTNEIREVHCASMRREQIVLTDIQAKKMVLLRGLNELQNIITAFSEMENANDTLVGKTVKTRPKFTKIEKYLKFDLSKITALVDEMSNVSNFTF